MTLSKEAQKIRDNIIKNFKVYCELVVNHYLSIGEQVAEQLTSEQIEATYEKVKKEEEEARKNNKFLFIGADFTRAILEACEYLAHTPKKARYNFIKYYLV